MDSVWHGSQSCGQSIVLTIEHSQNRARASQTVQAIGVDNSWGVQDCRECTFLYLYNSDFHKVEIQIAFYMHAIYQEGGWTPHLDSNFRTRLCCSNTAVTTAGQHASQFLQCKSSIAHTVNLCRKASNERAYVDFLLKPLFCHWVPIVIIVPWQECIRLPCFQNRQHTSWTSTTTISYSRPTILQ